MRKSISGKRYDTSKAVKVACAEFDTKTTMRSYSETLYRKRTGEYFLHGKGGSLSRYAEHKNVCDWCPGEAIIPMTEERAKEWAKKNLDADAYESAFRIQEESFNRRTLYIQENAWNKAKKEADRNGKSVSAYINDLILKQD